jgi:hypothetical protein
MLLKRSPQINIPEGDVPYIEQELGIKIKSTQAAETGQSSLFSGSEGVPAIGTPIQSSSAPQGFPGAPTTLYAAPFAPEAPPHFAPPQPEQQPAPEFAPEFSTPSATELPQSGYVFPPSAAPPFESPPYEAPPPLLEDWDGPVSNIPAPYSPANVLRSPQSFPSPITPSQVTRIPTNTEPYFPSTHYAPYANAEHQQADNGLRKIILDTENHDGSFTASNTLATSVPFVAIPPPAPPYSQAAARIPLTFESVKPDAVPGAPVITFTSLQRTDPVLRLSPAYSLQSSQSSPLTQRVAANHVAANPPAELINPLTPLAATRNPVAKPAEQEAVERFVHAQLLLIESGEPENIRRAFIHLGKLYEFNELGDSERAMIQPILDMLALEIIYARDTHLLEPPHRVKQGETLESIAKGYNLTSALLRKINGLTPAQEIPPGARLKVLHGQFDARISIKRQEMTLLLGGLYAGRFTFTMPNPKTPIRDGDYYVTHRNDRTLILNNGLALSTAPSNDAAFVFTEKDAREIFDILSEQSVIVIE